MKTLIRITLVIGLSLNLTSVSYGGLSATESFKIYVTIPPHVSTAIDELALLNNDEITTPVEEAITTPTLIETDEVVRNNQSIVLQSIVIR